MKPKNHPIFAIARTAWLATLALTSMLHAADQTWNPEGTSDFWSTLPTDENWTPGIFWTQGNSAIFGGTLGEMVTLDEDISAGNLTFSTAGYTIDGAGYTLTLADGSTIQADADATINATLAGDPITKTGTGSLKLGVTNFAGTLTVSQGRLDINNNGALGATANLVIGDANSGDTNPNLFFNNATPTIASLTVASGVTGAAVYSNSWAQNITGDTTLNSPLTIIRTGGGGVHGGFQHSGKITGPGAGAGNDSLIFQYNDGGNFYWQANNATANDFAGNIRVKSGTMNSQGGATGPNNIVIPDSAMVTIDAGATFRWNNFGNNAVVETFDGLAGAGDMNRNTGGGLITNLALTIAPDNSANEGKRVFSGSLASMNSLTINGTGTQEFVGAKLNYTVGTTLNNGTLKLTSTTGWASAIAFGPDNTPVLELNAPDLTDAWTFSKPITGDNTAATVQKTGAGTVSFTLPQTYKGATAVTAGKLFLASNPLPTDMPAIPGMTVWLDAADPDGNSVADTTDGASIGTWVNKGTLGATADFTASTAGANNPTYKASVAEFNSKPTINFVATDKMLANTVNFTNTVSVIYVGRIGATKQRLVSGGATNWILGYHGGNMGANWWNGGVLGSAADTNPHIWINGATGGANMLGYRFDAAGETALGNGTGGVGPVTGLTLGGGWSVATPTPTERSDGDIAELFVFDHQLTSEERQQLEGYLYNKYFGSQFGIVSLDSTSPVAVAANSTFGGYGVAGPITVANGGILQGGLDSGTGMLTVGNLTLEGTAILKGGVSATPGAKAISVANFTVNGGAQSVLLAGLAGTGLTDGAAYDFLTWSGTSNVTDASVFKKTVRNLTPTLDLANKKVQLTYSASTSSIYWTGGSSAWDASASNWKETIGDGATTYMTNDVVFFHDTTGSTVVDISAADVNPASTTFDATTTAYTLQGSKGIASGTITKNNAGTLTITNANPTSGAVALNGGTVSVSQTGSLGSGDLTLDGGVTLQYTGPTATSTRSVTIDNAVGAGGATMEVTDAGSAFTGGGLNGAGNLLKAGAGALGFGGAGTYTGAITLSGGTLVANHATALGAGSVTVAMGDAATGANPVEFKVDSAITSKVTLASISNSDFGSSHTITLNSGGALGDNAAALATTLNLSGSVPVTLKATNTGGHGTAQDVNWRIEGNGIPAGTTALILDGTTWPFRASQLSDTSEASNFTGDVLIKGNVTTQGRTYLAGGGTVAENQNLNFLNNDVILETGAVWRVVWGGETIGALNGEGQVILNNQNALNNIGLTLGNNGRDGVFSGTITGGFGLLKKGAGTQVLSGTGSSYSGPTVVENGTLQVDGSKTGGGAVSVEPYATLTGIGSVGGTTTVKGFGIIAPAGDELGGMQLANLTLQGVYQCNLDGTDADLLTVSGTLTIEAGAQIVFNGAPMEDRYVIGYYGELGAPLPVIAAPEGYIVTVDSEFNELVLRKPTGGYDTWAGANAPGQTMDQDYDNDGVPNGVEYFMGESGSGFTANPGLDAGFKVTWPMDAEYAGVYGTDYYVETSTNLDGDWQLVPQGQVTIVPGVSVSFTVPQSGPRKFARLVVTGP